MSNGPEPTIQEGSTKGKFWFRITIPGQGQTFGGWPQLHRSMFEARDRAAVDALEWLEAQGVQPGRQENGREVAAEETLASEGPPEAPPSSPPPLPMEGEASEMSLPYTLRRSETSLQLVSRNYSRSVKLPCDESSTVVRSNRASEEPNHIGNPLPLYCFPHDSTLCGEDCQKCAFRES
jgi:hypothetical protein